MFIGTDSKNAGKITLNIYAGKGTGGALLYTSLYNIAGAQTMQHFDLTGALPLLQSESLYTIGLASADTNTLQLAHTYTNPYTRGHEANPAADMYFQTYARLTTAVTLHCNLTLNSGSTLSVKNNGNTL